MQVPSSESEILKKLTGYLRMPSRRHHVTVHSNGRCLIRRSALRHFHIPTDGKVSIALSEDGATLTFNPVRGNKLQRPKLNGKPCSCIYFYSRHMARRALRAGQHRFRFTGPAERLPDGSCRITLSFAPVREWSTLWHKS